jgi:hypothetical protein
MIFLVKWLPLLVINGLIVGQKSFDLGPPIQDLNKIDFDKITDQNDVNKMYSDFEEAFIQTVDKHAPVKQRKPCQNPAHHIC